MTKKDWFVSILLGLFLGLVMFAFGYTNWIAPANARASESIDEILNLILNSHDNWETIQGKASITRYSPESESQSHIERFDIDPPGLVRLELLSSPEEKLQRLWISDGAEVFSTDEEKKTFLTSKLPGFSQDTTVLPKSLSEVDVGTVYHHPLELIMPSPVAEYIYPHWFAQGQPDAVYQVLRADKLLGRDVWVVEYKDSRNLSVAYIDQKTGVILRYENEMNNDSRVEFEMLSVLFDSPIDKANFIMPEGYTPAE